MVQGLWVLSCGVVDPAIVVDLYASLVPRRVTFVLPWHEHERLASDTQIVYACAKRSRGYEDRIKQASTILGRWFK
jgi:hypothetical protein